MTSSTGRKPALCLVLVLSSTFLFSQHVAPRARITSPVDPHQLITLRGNTHPLARAKYDAGTVPDTTGANRMLLLLSRSPEQQAALQQLLDDQQTQGSPHYRQWLTPAQFGDMFGPADADVQTVATWLGTQGFQVNHVSAAKTVIEFSGTAAQVRQAFHTQLDRYVVRGKSHVANATDPQIPTALAPVVKGIASLNNFERKPSAHRRGVFYRDTETGLIHPDFTVSGGGTTYYAIGPADFATIYNTKPLQQAGINGSGQTVAVVGRTNIKLQDVTDFRNLFALGAGNTSIYIDGPDPGIIQDDEFEALLDVEWANAAAPGASVVLVSAADTETTSGVDIAALRVVENNMAGVLSVSYGLCEAALGNTENQFIQDLWQQAAAQGITVVVASGDNGSAGCDDFNSELVATYGLAVNGVASTPFNVAAGGTDFNDASNPTQYWSSNNDTSNWSSALSYIPEMTWNDSCAGSATAANLNVCPQVPQDGDPPDNLNIVAAAGGASTCSSTTGSDGNKVCHGTPKPSWQSGPGVPNDSVRDLPDISLFSAAASASNSFYVLCMADGIPSYAYSCQISGGSLYFLAAGGTSVAAPGFAGMIALAEQKSGVRLGNVNYLLYSLAAQSGASCASAKTEPNGCIFNDIQQGNISVPCASGSPNCSVTTGNTTGVIIDSTGAPALATTKNYDLATGLGSVNATNLVNAIAAAVSSFKSTATTLTLNGATSQVTAKHGDPITAAVSVSPAASSGLVSLLGSVAAIDNNPLSGGLATWSTRLFPGGNYNVTAHYAGDGTHAASDSASVPVSIAAEPSQTFVNLVTFDLNGVLQSFTAKSAEYGSPYVLRMDVGDSAATFSSATGIQSNCSQRITSCPTGNVRVAANGAALDAGQFPLNAAGIAEDVRIQLTPGDYNLTADYPGDQSYGSSSGSTTAHIDKASTTTSVNLDSTSLHYGELVNVRAVVLSHSNGAFMNIGINLLVDGQPRSEGGNYGGLEPEPPYRYLSFATSDSFPIGTHLLAAQYLGDSNYESSTSDPVTITVQAAPTSLTLAASPNPGLARLPVTLIASISYGTNYGRQQPTGLVTFFDNGAAIGTASSDGTLYPTAELAYTFPDLGTHSITASYAGDANYLGSSTATPLPLVIQSQIVSVVHSVLVQPSPTVINYPARLQVAILPPDGGPAPTGTITFTDNGAPLTGTVTYNTDSYFRTYSATMSYPFTTEGTHTIAAAYSGDVNYLPNTASAVSVTVLDKLQPLVYPPFGASTAIVNQPMTLISYVYGVTDGPAIGGTVTFFDNGTPMDGVVSVTSGGYLLQASLTYTFNSTGEHDITVQYSGDTNYASLKSSDPLRMMVQGPLWISLGYNQITFGSGGGTQQVAVWINNNTSADSVVTLTCSSDSVAASCATDFSTTNISRNSNAFMWVNITVPPRTAMQRPAGSWFSTSGLLVCGVFMGAGLLRRRHRKISLLLPVLVMTLGFLSCGGGGSTNNGGYSGGGGGGGGITPPPTPITYHFTITATDGVNTNTQVITATEQ